MKWLAKDSMHVIPQLGDPLLSLRHSHSLLVQRLQRNSDASALVVRF